MRYVYTYADIKKLASEPYYAKIFNSPVITVSRCMRNCLNNLTSLHLRYKAVDFQDIFNYIIPHWLDEYDKLNKAALTEEFFRMKISETEDEIELEWLRNCRKNKFFLLSAIGLLAEASIEYEDLLVDSKEIQLMKDLYKYILKNDSSIQNLFSSIDSLANKDYRHSLFTKLFGNFDFDHIVFHGFYYITPLQERIIVMMEKCGYDLIFLIPYDSKYRDFFTIWERTYSAERGYPTISEWIQPSDHLSNVLGEVYASRSPMITNVVIHEQKDIISFVNDIDKTRSECYRLYSSDHAAANDMLHDFFPHEYERRPLFSYPLGQFIFNIHRCWDNDHNGIVLDETIFKNIVSSGWLSVDGNSSLDYLDNICSIYPFFQDCFELLEWENRLIYLKNQYQQSLAPFQEVLNKDDRIPFLSNPLLNFSLYSLSDQSFETIYLMMLKLFNLLHLLFDEQNALSIYQHFSKSKQFIMDNCPDIKIDSEELAVLSNIINRVSCNHPRLYSPEDVCSSVLFLLSQGFDSFGDDGSRMEGMVNPLYQLDSAILSSQKVHIILADIDRIPGKERSYVWPLNKKYIESLYCILPENKQYLIYNLKHIMKASPLLNKYMFFTALNNDDVIISWISKVNKKNIQPSPFIRLLNDKCHIPFIDVSSEQIPFKDIQSINPKNYQFISSTINLSTNLIKEARIDYALCPLKYIYGHVLNEHPYFKTQFTINLAIGGLISSLKGSKLNITTDEIIDAVYDLFPFIRNSEKRQTLECLSNEKFSYSEYKNYKYYEGRFLIEYPTKEYRKKAFFHYGLLASPNGRSGFDILNIPDIENICVFCQFSNDCRRAIHFDDDLRGLNDERSFWVLSCFELVYGYRS